MPDLPGRTSTHNHGGQTAESHWGDLQRQPECMLIWPHDSTRDRQTAAISTGETPRAAERLLIARPRPATRRPFTEGCYRGGRFPDFSGRTLQRAITAARGRQLTGSSQTARFHEPPGFERADHFREGGVRAIWCSCNSGRDRWSAGAFNRDGRGSLSHRALLTVHSRDRASRLPAI